jgi:hypothetical protein
MVDLLYGALFAVVAVNLIVVILAIAHALNRES